MTTHLSVRLTWHDSAWNACVCKEPACNVSCVQHKHVRESRKLDYEKIHAGIALSELEESLPPCSRDTGAYAEDGYILEHRDPLEHRRLPSTTEELPPYSCCPSPYRWLREENLRDICNAESFAIRPNDDGRESGWVYEPDRQRELLNKFWSKLEPGASLVFYYLNQANPLSEKDSRLLIGIGRIKKIGQQLYFGQKEKYEDDYPIWSRSITQNYPDEGVRLPYQEYLDSGHDVSNILCPVPAVAIRDFSYVGEHVNDDLALSAVERFIQAVEQVKNDGLVAGEWEQHLAWLDDVLGELWAGRGAFPGIGSILQYLGFPQGVAYQRFVLNPLMKKQVNIWEHVKAILNGEQKPEKGNYVKGLTKAGECWRKLTKKQDLLALLARFELTRAQIERIANPNEPAASGILSTDDEILANPYLLCEQDVGTKESEPVSLDTIDHGLRPEGYAALFPSDDEVVQADTRRIRAIAIDVLTQAAKSGDSLLSISELLELVKKRFPERRQCNPNRDLVEADEAFYFKALSGKLSGDGAWCAIKSLHAHEQYIAEHLKKRVKRTNKTKWEEKDWLKRLHAHPKIGKPVSEREDLAIKEKLIVLESLLSRRVSVLTGGAGTGKTTVLKVFLDGLEEIEGRRPFLLLAPTGKARVKLATTTGRNTGTVHQFLLKQGWYDPSTMILRASSKTSAFIAQTVVIDECSMIPADLFGTLLKTLDMDAITRLILVGDPNQLPPIGPGRPFADIITWMSAKAPQCVAQLDTCMRTEEGDEDKISTGLELANSYRATNNNPADDELLSALACGESVGDVEIRFWKDTDELMQQLKDCFSQHLNVQDNDYNAFSKSLGFEGKSPDWRKSEAWQILSPTRRDLLGTDEINRLVQQKFKGGLLSNSRNPWKKSYASPFGESEIIWSDKVIQITNEKRDGWPRHTCLDYVANGEIGLVEKTFKGEKLWNDYLQVIYSTQPETSYRYYRSEVDVLELAYALTVHKAQGSDFDTVYFILPQSTTVLSRELVYTALTRFRKKLVLLVERDIKPLLTFRHPNTSDVERRNSFVFDLIMRDEVNKIYPEHLIHRAKNGEPMRSKSEVIVANILLDLNLKPRYEEPLDFIKNLD